MPRTPPSARLVVSPSLMPNRPGLGVFGTGRPNSVVAWDTYIPFHGIFVDRDSPSHYWASWYICDYPGMPRDLVFIPDHWHPLPTSLAYTPPVSANFINAALHPSLLPTMPPNVPHRELDGASNTAVVMNFNYRIAGVRVIRALPADMELLGRYACFDPSRSISVDDLDWRRMSYTQRRLFVVQQLSINRRSLLWTDADFLTAPWNQVNLSLDRREFHQRLCLDVIYVEEELGSEVTTDRDPASTPPQASWSHAALPLSHPRLSLRPRLAAPCILLCSYISGVLITWTCSKALISPLPTEYGCIGNRKYRYVCYV